MQKLLQRQNYSKKSYLSRQDDATQIKWSKRARVLGKGLPREHPFLLDDSDFNPYEMEPKKSKSASVGKKKSLKKKKKKTARRSPVKEVNELDFDREDTADLNLELEDPIREVPAYGEEEPKQEQSTRQEDALRRRITELEKQLTERPGTPPIMSDEEKHRLEESASKYRDENDELIHEKIMIMQQKAKLEGERNEFEKEASEQKSLVEKLEKKIRDQSTTISDLQFTKQRMEK